MQADWTPKRSGLTQGRSSISASDAPRHVAIIGGDTPVGVALLTSLGRSPLVASVTVLMGSSQPDSHPPEFWPRKAQRRLVDFEERQAVKEALKGATVLYWCGGNQRHVSAITAATEDAGVEHLSVVSSSIWGAIRNPEVRAFEKLLKGASMRRLSVFRPRLVLPADFGPGPHAAEAAREAQDGLARLIGEGYGVYDHRSSAFIKGFVPGHITLGVVLNSMASLSLLPPTWHPSPAEAVARAMWLQSCWAARERLELYDSMAIFAMADIPEAMSRRWEQAVADHTAS